MINYAKILQFSLQNTGNIHYFCNNKEKMMIYP